MLATTILPSLLKGMKAGTATPTGTATTVFTIPHNLGFVPAFAQVVPQNALSAALYSVSWDATNITVTYLVGLTGSVSLGWMALA